MTRRLVVAGAMVAALGGRAAADDAADKAARKAAALADLRKQNIAASADNLRSAAMGGKPALVKTLIDAGLDPNAPDPVMQRPVMGLATNLLCVEKSTDAAARDGVFQALLDGGADPNAMDMGEIPVFVFAAQQCPRPVVEMFLKAGARLDLRSPQGFTPLSMALIVGNLDAAEALVDHGARLSAEAKAKLYPEPPTDPRVVALVKRATAPAAKPK